jgi:uncharacterized protein YlxW (UPF0749 family)
VYGISVKASVLTHHGTVVLQAQSSSLQQQVKQLEQQVKQLQELSDANGKVVQDKMANLVGECHVVGMERGLYDPLCHAARACNWCYQTP